MEIAIFKAPLNVISWLASFFWGSKVWEIGWAKGSVELRKGVRYPVHMLIFALGWEISCIHITRLSNCCHIFVKTKSFILHHQSLFLSIPFKPVSNPSNSTHCFSPPETWTQGSIKKGENFITPNLHDFSKRHNDRFDKEQYHIQ